MEMIPSPSVLNPWLFLRSTLRLIYEGAPFGKKGSFNAIVVAVWFMKKGEVVIVSPDGKTTAKAGQWVVCLPGMRYQEFSDSSRIVSMQFIVECSVSNGSWTGPLATVLDSNAQLNQLLRDLRRTKIVQRMAGCKLTLCERAPATISETLELHAATALFFRQLIQMLEKRGVFYKLCTVHDSRVRLSLRDLESDDFQKPFSRKALSSRYGLSSSQLDRLWRNELNTTPRHFLDRRRIKVACDLLELGEKSIKEIAFAVGFRYPSRFSIWFHAQFGESPRSFRNRHRI